MCYVAGCLLLMAALSACLVDDSNDEAPPATATAPSIEPTSTSAPVPSQPPTATATPSSPPPPPSPTIALLPAPVQAALDLAAETYAVPPEQITVLSFTERPWPSTALGCPQPGISYAQIVTPGYQVELDIAGRRLTYHTDMQTTVINCTGG
jgi:hypothetical protein